MLCNHLCMAAVTLHCFELRVGTGASEDRGVKMNLSLEGSLHRDCCLALDFCFSLCNLYQFAV